MKLAGELRENYGIQGEIDINTLLSIQGLIKFSQPQIESEGIYKNFKPILDRALKDLIQMKKKEGKNIAQDINESVEIIEDCVHEIERVIPERSKHYKENLLTLVKGSTNEVNEERLCQELLYMAERTDVTEECKRLFSHLMLFKESLDTEDHPGRRLNFLLQEMQREANTLSVKANYLKISKAAVTIKEEVEKIREQVQNLE